MLLDPNPGVYLNRPCYGYKTVPEFCVEALWTNARYGPEVVDSMALALTDLASRYPDKQWVLIGHSGGGALAMLLAGRTENVAAVVTLAANLDHRAWTKIRGFAPLDRSLNPVDEETLPPHIIRWHFAGGGDHQVPASITETAAARDPNSRFVLEPEFDHSCCWEQIWPRILKELDAQLTGTK
jgi:dienelactone hydrolase